MNIFTNESMIKRNARIGQIAMLAGLVVLGGGMFLSFSQKYAQYFYLTLLALLFGFILSQVGIYFTNHYGRRPRPDEQINLALKGLDGKYTVYHYLAQVPHLLVGPAGVWVLMPRNQKGTITFSKGRWKQRGGSLYLKIFAQEGLGRPDIDVEAEIGKVRQLFEKNMPAESVPPIQAVLVFTNPAVKIDIDEEAETPAVTVTVDKLKEAIRKTAKAKALSATSIQQITGFLPGESK